MQEAVGLLQDIKTAVNSTHRKGEAFVVLKSDAVLHMADMQILCFRSDFGQHLATWKQNWNTAYETQLREFEAKNPELQAKLKSLDEQIAQADSQKNTVKQAASEAVADLVRRLESEKEALQAQQAKHQKAYEEYEQIIKPFDEQIKDLSSQAQLLQSNQRTLATQTIEKLNLHILEAQLTVPKLKMDVADSLFEINETNGDSREKPLSIESGGVNPFLLERRVDSTLSGWYYWVFLIKMPAELEGTQSESVVKAAYREWSAMQSKLKATNDQLLSQSNSKVQALIPWENRHGIQHQQGVEIVSKRQEVIVSLQQVTEKLANIKGGSKEGSDMIDAEIQQRLRKIADDVEVIKNHRKELLEESARSASLELKREYSAKFYALLKRHSYSDVHTGSKGDFSVPADITYLYAERHRDNGETLIWLLRVNPTSPDIKLSNSNAAAVGSRHDEFWMMESKVD